MGNIVAIYKQMLFLIIDHYIDQDHKTYIVRSGIRTHAHRSGLRPERSALDRSAILTTQEINLYGIT